MVKIGLSSFISSYFKDNISISLPTYSIRTSSPDIVTVGLSILEGIADFPLTGF